MSGCCFGTACSLPLEDGAFTVSSVLATLESCGKFDLRPLISNQKVVLMLVTTTTMMMMMMMMMMMTTTAITMMMMMMMMFVFADAALRRMIKGLNERK
jgi:hypothetical protein